VRHSCPAPTGPQPPPIIHEIFMETPTSPWSFRASRSDPRNRRSLCFARDDKKERAAVHKEWLLTEAFSNLIWTALAELRPLRNPGKLQLSSGTRLGNGVLKHAPKATCRSFNGETLTNGLAAYFASVTGIVNVCTLAGDVAVISAL
jgi:hypothetical protein